MILQTLQIFGNVGDKCTLSGSNFFAFPKWYEYLGKGIEGNNSVCVPHLTGLSDVWLILAAVIDILLRIAAMAAVAMIIYGGITYTTSQGEPESTAKAKNTIVNALVGLALAVTAAFIITFIARSIT